MVKEIPDETQEIPAKTAVPPKPAHPGAGLIQPHTGHTGAVTAVAVLPDRRHVISGSSDHTLQLWGPESGQEIKKLEGHTGGATAVAVLPNGQRVLSGSSDQTLRLWNLDSGECLARFDMDTAVTCCAVVPDERFIIVGDDQGSIHVLESIQ